LNFWFLAWRLPSGCFSSSNFFEGIPRELEDVARIDGCCGFGHRPAEHIHDQQLRGAHGRRVRGLRHPFLLVYITFQDRIIKGVTITGIIKG